MFITALIRIIEVFFWPIRMSSLQFNFLLVYSHLFYFYCKYIKNHICELHLKKQFESNLRINEHYLSSSEAYRI